MNETAAGPTVVRKRPQRFSWGCLFWILLILLLIVPGLVPISRVLEKAKMTDARVTMTAVLNAITSFERDNDRLPLQPAAPKAKDFDTDTSPASGMIALLMGMDVAGNPRVTDYLGEIKEAKVIKDKLLGGLYRQTETTIGLYDPWGQPYRIRLDGDSDGGVDDPSAPGTRIPKTIAIWSAGKDGDFSTWEDNAASWKR